MLTSNVRPPANTQSHNWHSWPHGAQKHKGSFYSHTQRHKVTWMHSHMCHKKSLLKVFLSFRVLCLIWIMPLCCVTWSLIRTCQSSLVWSNWRPGVLADRSSECNIFDFRNPLWPWALLASLLRKTEGESCQLPSEMKGQLVVLKSEFVRGERRKCERH